MKDFFNDVRRISEAHLRNKDPRSLSEQFPGLDAADTPIVERLVSTRMLSYEEAVDRIKGRRQMDEIREKMGNILGENFLGNSFVGKWANRIRDRIMLLDIYDYVPGRDQLGK